jgi:hypothetical protein
MSPSAYANLSVFISTSTTPALFLTIDLDPGPSGAAVERRSYATIQAELAMTNPALSI